MSDIIHEEEIEQSSQTQLTLVTSPDLDNTTTYNNLDANPYNVFGGGTSNGKDSGAEPEVVNVDVDQLTQESPLSSNDATSIKLLKNQLLLQPSMRNKLTPTTDMGIYPLAAKDSIKKLKPP